MSEYCIVLMDGTHIHIDETTYIRLSSLDVRNAWAGMVRITSLTGTEYIVNPVHIVFLKKTA